MIEISKFQKVCWKIGIHFAFVESISNNGYLKMAFHDYTDTVCSLIVFDLYSMQ